MDTLEEDIVFHWDLCSPQTLSPDLQVSPNPELATLLHPPVAKEDLAALFITKS